ncbi:hypothetical protein N181_22300 [Sinorhizobium fredii USDA 205]|nr:hypothetical protein N181_22300 [Sinorhizobium fredii USDA 205]
MYAVNREAVSRTLHLKRPLPRRWLFDQHRDARLNARLHRVWRRLIGRLY